VTSEIRVAAGPGEARVAMLRDCVLDAYEVWRPGLPDGVGDIHRGRVLKPVRAMAGAFVAIEGAEGFLPDSEGAKGLSEGDSVIVRVTRAAQGGKGPRLSARLPGSADDAQLLSNTTASEPAVRSGPVRLLRRGANPIERLAAAHPDAAILVDDHALAGALRPVLGHRVSLTRAPFDDALATEIDGLAETTVPCFGGGSLSIHPTPALTAIDVDTGGAVAERGGKTERHVAVNRALLPELARQIRLRNLSGAIVVDLAGLPMRGRSALAPAFHDALANDPLRPRFLGFTALGLAEILRPRVHPPLHELLRGPHAAGLAALRAIAAQIQADPRRLPVLWAAPAVVSALQGDPVALPDLARRAGRDLIIRSDPTLTGTQWSLQSETG
jgi:Ribonuclease G/E